MYIPHTHTHTHTHTHPHPHTAVAVAAAAAAVHSYSDATDIYTDENKISRCQILPKLLSIKCTLITKYHKKLQKNIKKIIKGKLYFLSDILYIFLN